MMKNQKAPLTIFVGLHALAGCGDSSGSGGDVSLGISGSKLLGEVTPDEATRGCFRLQDDIEARFNPVTLKPKLCTLGAVSLSSTEASCNSARDACVQDDTTTDDAELNPAEAFSCNETSIDHWQGCSATVGEMETCINDTLDALDDMLSAYTCRDAGTLQLSDGSDCTPPPIDANTGRVAIDPLTGLPYENECADSPSTDVFTPATPGSCQALQTQCPTLGLFEE